MLLEIYIMEYDNEEFYWIVTSFLAASYSEQLSILNKFILTPSSDLTIERNVSEKLYCILWCFRRYMPDYLDDDVCSRSIELYSLLGLIMDYYILENIQHPEVIKYLSCESMEENEIWQLVRRIAKSILLAWSLEQFEFKEDIDLDHYGPE